MGRLYCTALNNLFLTKEWTKVYYVRKAAKTALEQMKESVDNIVIEEPDN